MIREHGKCRLCQSSDVITILDFGETALANSYPEDLDKEEIVSPLVVFSCSDCCSVQLKHTVDPMVLYKNYLYESSTTKSFQEHFANYANEVYNRFHPYSVCEIGSNDGILLKPFQKLGCKVFGIEPAEAIAAKACADGIPTLATFFDKKMAKIMCDTFGTFDVVTANNVFAHIDDLHDVIEGVKLLLSDDGVFVFENAYLLDTIQNLYFDQVYAEHLYYHSLKPLSWLFYQHKMQIVDVERNAIQGGTIRVFVKKSPCFLDKKKGWLTALFDEEQLLYDLKTYDCLKKQLVGLKTDLHKMLECYRNKVVCAYGAPAKFTTFCKVMELDGNKISFVIDDAPLKQGRYTPGTHIPIRPRESLAYADICLITAWNFAQSIIDNNTSYKGKWIIPMPKVKLC
jgi:SAM-dependent methyltransferase